MNPVISTAGFGGWVLHAVPSEELFLQVAPEPSRGESLSILTPDAVAGMATQFKSELGLLGFEVGERGFVLPEKGDDLLQNIKLGRKPPEVMETPEWKDHHFRDELWDIQCILYPGRLAVFSEGGLPVQKPSLTLTNYNLTAHLRFDPDSGMLTSMLVYAALNEVRAKSFGRSKVLGREIVGAERVSSRPLFGFFAHRAPPSS